MEVISYRELQRIPHKVLDALLDEDECEAQLEDKKVIVTIDNQYHYEIKRFNRFEEGYGVDVKGEIGNPLET